MCDDGVHRRWVPISCVINRKAPLPKITCLARMASNIVQPRGKPDHFIPEVLYDLLHTLECLYRTSPPGSFVPCEKCPLPKLMEHPHENPGIVGTKHCGRSESHKGELAPCRPKVRDDLVLQLLQHPDSVSRVVRCEEIL